MAVRRGVRGVWEFHPDSATMNGNARAAREGWRLMFEMLKDLWDFMRERKKFWLAPIVIVLVLLGGLIIFAEGSVVAPFIYTLF